MCWAASCLRAGPLIAWAAVTAQLVDLLPRDGPAAATAPPVVPGLARGPIQAAVLSWPAKAHRARIASLSGLAGTIYKPLPGVLNVPPVFRKTVRLLNNVTNHDWIGQFHDSKYLYI